MDKPSALKALMGHIQAAREAGQPDAVAEQAFQKYQSMNPATQADASSVGSSDRSASGNTVPITQQLSQQNLQNSPSQQYANQMGSPGAPQPQEQPAAQGNDQNMGGMDIQSLLKQLKVTPLQSIGNAMSVLGGGKPIYDPDMQREFIKQGGAYKMQMAPYEMMLKSSQAQNQQAGAGYKNQQTQFVQPKAESLMGQQNSQEELNTERAKNFRRTGQMVDKAMGSGEVDENGTPIPSSGPNFEISSVSGSRGPTLTNMDYLGQKAGIGAAVKPLEVQNAKIDSGLHALRVMDQNFNSQTGQFDIAKMNKAELDQNLAQIISGQGPSSDARVEGVRQSSLAGTLSDKIGYLIGKPVNVVTPEVAKLLHQTLIGQIHQSSLEREPYKQQLGISQFGNDPEQYFAKSPSYQYYYGAGQGSQPSVERSQTGGQRVGKYTIH